MKTFLQQALQGILDAEARHFRSKNPPDAESPRPLHRRRARRLHTRMGTLKVLVPPHCVDQFDHRIRIRYRTREAIILLALARMYVRGLPSVRMVRAVAEELCGHRFSQRTIARLAQVLHGEFAKWMRRQLAREMPRVGFAPAWRVAAFHGEI